MNCPIVFEDETILVLNKPSGIPSQPLRAGEAGTAFAQAIRRCPAIASAGPHPLEGGLLHRLDIGTSGLLVFAKTLSEFHRLRDLWKQGSVTKIYRALVLRKERDLPRDLPFVIEDPLGHSAKSSKKMIALHHPGLFRQIRGKPLPAKTEILRIHRGHHPVADLEIQIHTGVMHQIRCHLASRGWPILGDKTYGGQPSDRLFLHAWKLKIGSLHLEAPLPLNWKRD